MSERELAREKRAAELAALDDAAVLAAAIEEVLAAEALLWAIGPGAGSALGRRVAMLLPELAALGVTADGAAAVEHEQTAGVSPLIDHVMNRALGRKLRGLCERNLRTFQNDEALSARAFADEVARWDGPAMAADGRAVVQVALMHLDVAKGGDLRTRAGWAALPGVDLSVHNVAGRRLLEATSAIDRWESLGSTRATALILELVEVHGLAGQAVRGETPLAAFAGWVRYLRSFSGGAAETAQWRARAIDCWHFVNLCDTAAVREGLYTDALRAELMRVEGAIARVAERSGSVELVEIERELAAEEDAAWKEHGPRDRLADRLARLRKGRIDAGEPRAEIDAVVAGMSEDGIVRLGRLLSSCQLWYCEAGTAALEASVQVKLLALALAAAERGRTDVERPYHVTLLPLVAKLHRGRGADGRVGYRVRLVEALLRPLTIAGILEGARPAAGGLVAFETEIGGGVAVAVRMEESEEAGALLTLLPIYEKKSSAAFHSTLKTLCDLYGLRKDDFDRVANEEMYLVTMNAARSDKARMLDWARAGKIVEVGPGGGVVLDLLAERFVGSEVVGVDVSKMVIDALEEKRAREGRTWTVLEADAFRMPEVMGAGSVDTIVYCSVLHEIYSYCEHEGRKFQLEPVRDLLQASWRTLRAGGRLIVRDGVMPPRGETWELRLIAEDAREALALFAAQFEGRKIVVEEVGADRVRMKAEDATEWVLKYNWGPASFPYEVREQYCVRPYEEYRALMVEWLGSSARVVEIPEAERSYLQQGYVDGLRDKVEIFDAAGRPRRLPDSNALWVLEKN